MRISFTDFVLHIIPDAGLKIMIWDITQNAHIFGGEYPKIPKFRDICEISLFLIIEVSLLKRKPRA